MIISHAASLQQQQTYWVIRMLGKHVRQERRHPSLNRIGEAINNCAYTQDSGVEFTKGETILGRLAGREGGGIDKAHEAVL